MKTTLKSLLLLALIAITTLALADPPARVGRISVIQGEVYFRNAASGESGPAEVNWPLTSQNVITTEPGARAELRVGSTAVRVGPDSELDVVQLDDMHFKLFLAYGTANVRVKSRDMVKDFELQTPQGRILLNEPSRIRVDAERGTLVSVWSGTIRFESPESNLAVRAGKRVEFINGDIRMSEIGANPPADEFDAWALARDQRDDQSMSVRYLSPEATGYEELDQYGNWQDTSEYGAVWYPRSVPVDWAPYRAGRWTWVEPWGWTWVDSTPWGYAPSHYGRWVLLRNRWCWAPGTLTPRPVWAPALVGWVGGPNWSVSFSSGSAPAVGWFPLAPREMYVPSYAVSPTYIRQINVTHVANITNVTNLQGIANLPPQVNYQNRFAHNALTVVPQERFRTGRMVVIKEAPPSARHAQQFQAAPLSPVVPAVIARTHGVNVISAPAVGPGEHRRNGEGRHGREHVQTQQQTQQPVLQAVPAPAPAAAPPLPRFIRETPSLPAANLAPRPEERVMPKVEHPRGAVHLETPAAAPVVPTQERRESRSARSGHRPEGVPHQAPPQAPQQLAPPVTHQAPPVESRGKPQEHPRGEAPASSPAEAGRGFMPYHPERGGR